jgi:hypothetical protein
LSVHERELIEALLDGDGLKWRSAALSLGDDRTLHVQVMTFVNACMKQFPGDVSASDITAYVKRLRDSQLPGADLRVAPTELLIRAVLTEPEIAKDVSGMDLVAAHLVVINTVANDFNVVGASRDAFVAEILEALD